MILRFKNAIIKPIAGLLRKQDREMGDAHMDLFETLTSSCACPHISDLRFSVPEPLLGCISILCPEDFPLTQWYDLYEYLTGTRKFFSTQEQARAELIRFIQEK